MAGLAEQRASAVNSDGSNAALREELLRRREHDQAVRGAVPPAERWPTFTHEQVEAVDADNTEFLKRVIAKHGWPGRDLVSKHGAAAAWLLVQHADHDREFQKQCLPLLRDAVAAGQADPAELAYLTDRVRVGEGRPQVFGTQYTRGPDGAVPHPIEDPEDLDVRRERAGLGPHAEYDQAMRRLNG